MAHTHAQRGQRPQKWGPQQYKYYGLVKQNDPAALMFVPRVRRWPNNKTALVQRVLMSWYVCCMPLHKAKRQYLLT